MFGFRMKIGFRVSSFFCRYIVKFMTREVPAVSIGGFHFCLILICVNHLKVLLIHIFKS